MVCLTFQRQIFARWPFSQPKVEETSPRFRSAEFLVDNSTSLANSKSMSGALRGSQGVRGKVRNQQHLSSEKMSSFTPSTGGAKRYSSENRYSVTSQRVQHPPRLVTTLSVRCWLRPTGSNLFSSPPKNVEGPTKHWFEREVVAAVNSGLNDLVPAAWEQKQRSGKWA